MNRCAICTCQWSRVDTTTIDPPHIVARDPDCPLHGVRAQPDFFEEDENELSIPRSKTVGS